jgi:hypothetical protein
MRREIEKEIEGKCSKDLLIELIVDNRLTRRAIVELYDKVIPVVPIVAALRKDCPAVNKKCEGGHCAENERVKEIEARGKVWLALSDNWGKIILAVAGMILAALAGHYIPL